MSRRTDFIATALESATDQCILWPFAVRKTSGYGAHKFRGKNCDAHRFVCTQAHGIPQENDQASHLCGVKLCINPRHLQWKTASENMADAKRHGTLRGGGLYRQKLTSEDVLLIRQSCDSILRLAARFGVDATYISRIRRRRAWKGV